MQVWPNGWTEAREGYFRMESKVEIAGVEHGEEEIFSLSTNGALFSDGTVSVGNCVAKEIDLEVMPKGEIPRMAEIKVFVRPVADGVDTDWLQKGVFYIDTRQEDHIYDECRYVLMHIPIKARHNAAEKSERFSPLSSNKRVEFLRI